MFDYMPVATTIRYEMIR